MLKFVGKCLAGFLYGGCLCHVTTEYFICLIKCEGDSMYPTINSIPSINDHMIIERFRSREYKKNDIIVLACPDQPEKLICKRITRLAGEDTPTSTLTLSIVPRCHVWVEGDNKQCSYDSHNFGPVPLGLVKGRVIFRVWPLSNFGRVT